MDIIKLLWCFSCLDYLGLKICIAIPKSYSNRLSVYFAHQSYVNLLISNVQSYISLFVSLSSPLRISLGKKLYAVKHILGEFMMRFCAYLFFVGGRVVVSCFHRAPRRWFRPIYKCIECRPQNSLRNIQKARANTKLALSIIEAREMPEIISQSLLNCELQISWNLIKIHLDDFHCFANTSVVNFGQYS